jgi:hypothetical protein
MRAQHMTRRKAQSIILSDAGENCLFIWRRPITKKLNHKSKSLSCRVFVAFDTHMGVDLLDQKFE